MARVRRGKAPTFKQRLTQRVRRVLLNLHEGDVPLERVAAADLNALSSEDWLRDLAGVGEQEQEQEQEEKKEEKKEEEKKEEKKEEEKEGVVEKQVEKQVEEEKEPSPTKEAPKEAPKKRPPKLIRKLQRKPAAGMGMSTMGVSERVGSATGAAAVRAEPAADMRIPCAAAAAPPTASPTATAAAATTSTAPAKASPPKSHEDEPAAKRVKRKGGGMVSSILGDMSSLLGRSSTAGSGGPASATAPTTVPPATAPGMPPPGALQQWPARRTPLLPPSMQRMMRGRGRGRGGSRGRGRGRGGRAAVVSAGGRVGGLLPRPMGSHGGSAGGLTAPPPYLAPKPMEKAASDMGRMYNAPTVPPPPAGGAGGGGYVPGMVASSMEARARYAPPAKATGASNMLAQYLKKSSSTAATAATGPTPRPFGAPPLHPPPDGANGAPRPM